MLVTILLQNGLTDFYEILYTYSIGLIIGHYLFFIPLSDKGCAEKNKNKNNNSVLYIGCYWLIGHVC